MIQLDTAVPIRITVSEDILLLNFNLWCLIQYPTRIRYSHKEDFIKYSFYSFKANFTAALA